MIDVLDAAHLLDFLQNASALAVLAIAYSVILRWSPTGRNLMLGLAFGLGAMLSMTSPVVLGPGVMIDSRTVIMGLAAPVAGLEAAVVAALLASGYRLVLGGVGVYSGVVGIVLCAGLGIALWYALRRSGRSVGIGHLVPLGVAVAVVTQASFLLMPAEVATDVLRRTAMPLSASLVFGTLLLGTLLVVERRRQETETELSRRERQLARRNALLHSQQELAPFGILVANENRAIRSWNRRFLEMWKLTETTIGTGDERTVLAAMLKAVVDPDEYARAVDHLYRHLDEEETGTAVTLRDGRTIERSSRAILGQNGEPWGRVWFFRDITGHIRREQELRDAGQRLEEQAQELAALAQDLDRARIAALTSQAEAEAANRAKSAFLASMSHELRTPLNAVLAFSEIIRDRLLGPDHPKYAEYAADIHYSGQHLLDMINDVLDLAKVEAEQMELSEGAVDLKTVVDRCLRMVEPRAASGRVRLQASVAPEVRFLRADERRLTQILLNLVTNAVKFTPEGGSVDISARRDRSEGIAIVVTDTGVGIRPEDMQRIFEPFGQGTNALVRKVEGTGLGLPLARRLLELHGGTLRLSSQPGAGTVATAILPADRMVETAA